MRKKDKRFCKDCGMPSICHIQTWIDELTNRFLPRLILPRKIELFFDTLLEKFFTFSRLASLKSDFTRSDIQLRTTCFIKEAKKRGVKFKVLHGPFGYTNWFRAEISDKVFQFESLPTADFASEYGAQFIDDKKRTKSHLLKGNFPVAKGRSFWFWQKKRAIEFGVKQIGFPLVIKPRSGSVSRHVTTDIRNIEKLKQAINKAIVYSPAFIVEKFISNAFVHRATVIDFDFVACVKQIPANVVGNGVLSIRELIDKKNSNTKRGEPYENEYVLYKIVENEISKKMLSKQECRLSTIPKNGEVIFLQQDPFLKLGGDLIEVTPEVHPDNFRLFREVAKFFDIRVVGIDFLIQNISHSWKNQQCAILELNSVPCIELHHFPSSGTPQNAAKAVTDLFFKYYL